MQNLTTCNILFCQKEKELKHVFQQDLADLDSTSNQKHFQAIYQAVLAKTQVFNYNSQKTRIVGHSKRTFKRCQERSTVEFLGRKHEN